MTDRVRQKAEELCQAERCCGLDQLHSKTEKMAGREKADAVVDGFLRRAAEELGVSPAQPPPAPERSSAPEQPRHEPAPMGAVAPEVAQLAGALCTTLAAGLHALARKG